MAVISNKPSSPNISSRVNPNARSSEIGNPVRRSFNGGSFTNKPSIIPNLRGINPNTPANSPSDNLRSNSYEEDKENSKSAKVRSPMGPKCTKNFMSPTISAASKVTPSPRKKILEDRNETFSESKIPSFFDPKPKIELEEAPTESMPEKSCVSEESDLVNLGPSFKINPASDPIIAPLDSDPRVEVVAPYDPKTNYLSPRPRFLHYKPNPRVELYLNKARDGRKSLEESFVSGLFSDTEEGTDSDVSSGVEAKSEETQEEEEELVVVPDPCPIDKCLSPEKAKKPSPVRRSKLIPFLTVLSIVCVSIMALNSTVAVDRSFFDGSSSFFEEFEYTDALEFAKTGIDGLAQKLGIWYENSVSFIYHSMKSYRGKSHEIGSFHYMNLTEAFDNVNGYDVSVFVPTNSLELIDIIDEFDVEDKAHQESETCFDVEEEGYEVLKADLVESEMGLSVSEGYEVLNADLVESENGFDVSEPEADSTPISKASNEAEAAKSELVGSENAVLIGEFEADPSQISQPIEETLPEVFEVRNELVVASSGTEVEPEPSEPGTSSFELDPKILQMVICPDETEEVNDSKLTAIGVALFSVFVAIVSTAFASAFGGKDSVVAGRDFAAKKLDLSPENGNDNNTLEVKHSSWNYSGDYYCSSEMSSYEINDHKGPVTCGLSEAQSYKKTSQRRESMDSSMGSPSYGSFTTYEKIPVKNGYGEEEIITPVRRSSRLRTPK